MWAAKGSLYRYPDSRIDFGISFFNARVAVKIGAIALTKMSCTLTPSASGSILAAPMEMVETEPVVLTMPVRDELCWTD